jgi:hypothetical protein
MSPLILEIVPVDCGSVGQRSDIPSCGSDHVYQEGLLAYRQPFQVYLRVGHLWNTRLYRRQEQQLVKGRDTHAPSDWSGGSEGKRPGKGHHAASPCSASNADAFCAHVPRSGRSALPRPSGPGSPSLSALAWVRRTHARPHARPRFAHDSGCADARAIAPLPAIRFSHWRVLA